MADKEPGRSEQPPDFTDEAFWSELNQKLWLLFRDGSQALAEEDSRKKNCLAITRCHEIAEKPATILTEEKAHLEGCRYCVRQIKSFSKLLSQPVYDDAPIIDLTIEKPVPKNLHVPGAIIESGSWLNASRARAVLAIVIILAIGAGVFFVFQSRLFRKTEIVSKPTSDQPERVPNPNNANSPDDPGNVTPPPKNPENKNSVAVDKKPSPSKKQPLSVTADGELKSLSTEDQRVVLTSTRSEEILLAGSEFEKLTTRTTRGFNNDEVSPVYPRNEATLEQNPSFRWQGPGNREYRIIATYLGGELVGESEVLSQNDGRLKENLAPGFYYWRLAMRSSEGKERIVTGFISFKILSEKEKQQLAAGINSTQSHVVRAILYTRAGFLTNAETELNAELNKNPHSSIARKMLTQVQRLRRR